MSQRAEVGEATSGWSGTVRSAPFGWLAALMVGIAVWVWSRRDVPAAARSRGAAAAASAAVVIASIGWVRVSVDRRGLRVASVLTRIPLRRIPLGRVRDARSERLRPMRWGGWGYRILPGRAAIVHRDGPGLVVTQTSGRRFAVSLDDPEPPARLLVALARGIGPSPGARAEPDAR